MSQTQSARDVPAGGYRFLPGIAPFSSGAAASPGPQGVHATLREPVPWREGFGLIDRHLRAESRPRAALCAIELRSPAPFSFAGFDGFNAGYQALLAEWKLLIGGENPIARTNVAPIVGAPSEPALYGFGYTVPGASARPRAEIRPPSWPPRSRVSRLDGSGETRRGAQRSPGSRWTV